MSIHTMPKRPPAVGPLQRAHTRLLACKTLLEQKHLSNGHEHGPPRHTKAWRKQPRATHRAWGLAPWLAALGMFWTRTARQGVPWWQALVWQALQPGLPTQVSRDASPESHR